MAALVEGVGRAAHKLSSACLLQAPLTGIGVAALAEPGLLVVVEVVAIIVT
jgi:hypothetical protein